MTGGGWVVSLSCGHQARLGHNPPAGGFITCMGGGCQGQRRVTAVDPAPVVYVQDELFGEDAA